MAKQNFVKRNFRPTDKSIDKKKIGKFGKVKPCEHKYIDKNGFCRKCHEYLGIRRH